MGSGKPDEGALEQRERNPARGLLAAGVVAFWLTPVKAALLDGNFTGLAAAFGAEQALVLVLTAALLASLLGWAWRRWQQTS